MAADVTQPLRRETGETLRAAVAYLGRPRSEGETMNDSGLDEFECRKAFSDLGAVIAGTRLASITDATVQSLQRLATGAGESGVTVYVSDRQDARGPHPRVDSVRFSDASLPATDLQASIEADGHAISFGWQAPVADVVNLFFDLDVERLPFEEAVRATAAKHLAAVPKTSHRKRVGRRS
jgi:hypothetical protein